MLYLFIVLIVIISVLLVLVVLAQDSKGGGFASNVGSSQLMGVKKTTDLLERLTWGFAIGLMVLSVSAAIFTGFDSEEGGPNSINVETAKTKTVQQPPAQKPSVGPTPTGDTAAQK